MRSSPCTCWGRNACTSPRRRVTVPPSGSSRPARIASSVDLPPPFGPSTPTRMPSASSRSSPSRMRRPPNDFLMSRAERSGTLAMGDGYVRSMEPVVHVAPESDRAIEEAVTAAGGRVGPLEEADALVWLDSNPDSLPDALPDACPLGAAAVGGRGELDRAGRPRAGLDLGRGRLRAAGRRARAGADARRRPPAGRLRAGGRPGRSRPRGRSTGRRWRSSAPAASGGR